MKKILILDTGKEWGGGTNSLLELLKRVDKKRYSFTALFYHNYRKGASGAEIKAELAAIGVDFIRLERPGKRFYSRGMKEAGRAIFSVSPSLKRKYVFYFDLLDRVMPDSRRIARVLIDGHFDLLYMNNQPSSNLEGLLAAKEAGVPCVQHSRIAVKLKPFEARVFNRHVSKIICVSGGVMEWLTESGADPKKCTVVCNGIDPAVRPARPPQEVRLLLGATGDTAIIGTVCSLIKRKRVGLLIDAMAELKKSAKKDVRCVVLGEGPEMEPLREQARTLGVEDSVVFIGFVADALSYINAMDVFVLPSAKEGLPRVVLEAMLSSKPVVAFDIPGVAELVDDRVTGVIVKTVDGASIARETGRIINDRGLARSMGEAGRKRVVEKFGIDRYVSGVERVFKEALR